jgi:crotonobetainyl-CoA:carnitine CoA-transferase CaiB-like acyl-CoA transferase
MSEEVRFAPLSGVRVVDFCSNLAGPYGAMILAQLGADVIKVEPPGGDDSRSYASSVAGVSVGYSHVNVGKRGIVIDLKNAAGLEAALRLIETADVVLQSMRPGVADRLGIGSAAALERNPEVLYYDVNAFGAGPMGARLPGYDPLVQAFTGIMEMTGHEGSPPTRCAPSVVDLGTGQWVAMGVLAALLARRNGTPVAAIETALVDTAFSLVGYQASSAYASGERPPRAGSGNPIAAPYQCYEASDGWVLIAAANQRLWEGVTRALGAPDLAADERFTTIEDRTHNREALEVAITNIMRHEPVDTWIERFAAERVPAGRVLGLEQAVVSDVAVERETFETVAEVPLVRLPWLVDGARIPWARPAPRLGEQTVEVLTGAGYGDDEIAELIASGAVIDGQRPAA